MNKDRIFKILKYVLLVAGLEDDYTERDLGPIHFIKYVYLADLHYAAYNNGATYTGVKWKFHNFGPWSNDVNNCIEPALNEIGACCKTIPSKYENCNDYKRWSLSDDRLLEKLEQTLPVTVTGKLGSLIHKYGNDTPSLLEQVYNTKPMLKAAPEETLDFSSVSVQAKEKKAHESKFETLSIKKQKKFKQAISSIRRKKQTSDDSLQKGFLPSPLPTLHDNIYFEGLDWIESLSGDPVVSGDYEAHFSDNVWHSKIREGDFPE